MKKRKMYFPVTPSGTSLTDLESPTKSGAIKNLLSSASHIYSSWEQMMHRGYTIDWW